MGDRDHPVLSTVGGQRHGRSGSGLTDLWLSTAGSGIAARDGGVRDGSLLGAVSMREMRRAECECTCASKAPIPMEPSGGSRPSVEPPSGKEVDGWWCVTPDCGESEASSGDQKTSRTVVISDIHMGTNAPTCWYQKTHHECYLAALLEYVAEHARLTENRIGALVILGDLFDFWTYPPDQRPPTINEIIDANDKILGPNGALSKAVRALDGNVVFLHGNHDIE